MPAAITIASEEQSEITPHNVTSESSRDAIVRAHRMPFGAELRTDGRVRFRLWGPGVSSVGLELDEKVEPIPMSRNPEGWHELVIGEAHEGTLYRFVLPDGLRVPDPASRFQPKDVHGPSQVVRPESYLWQDFEWKGRPWAEAVLYELHIGTFTQEGTFLAAIEKLDHLAELGITAIEIMPVADFPGNRGWGYDGVLLYAPESAYGRPEDLKALVQAAHARGISVVLDVVYNHFGPDGNYLSTYFPNIFTTRHKTSWGDALNYDSEDSQHTRELVIHNALYWIEEFHIDGLRLDAVHAIIDESPKHLLDELADRARSAVRHSGSDRPIHLILENEHNEARRLERDDRGRPIHFTAQWNDDVHHVLHTAATHEDAGYYGGYTDDTEKLGRALAEGFAFQGEIMASSGNVRGESSAHLPPSAFIAFIQNHDQVGNRAFGERLGAIASLEAVRAVAAVYLLLPQVPMLFMGEEWNASQPFPYFCDFEGELGEKVRTGRRQEFASFPEFKDPKRRESIPDPQAEETFLSAKLDWSEIDTPNHAQSLEWYRRILAVRRQAELPLLKRISGGAGSYEIIGAGAVIVRWQLDGGQQLQLEANLSDNAQSGFSSIHKDILWHEGTQPQSNQFAPWTVRWSFQPASE